MTTKAVTQRPIQAKFASGIDIPHLSLSTYRIPEAECEGSFLSASLHSDAELSRLVPQENAATRALHAQSLYS
jgi:hypothetical protein